MLGYQLKLSARVSSSKFQVPTGTVGYALVETVKEREEREIDNSKLYYYIVEFKNLHTKLERSSRVDDDGFI